MCINVIPTNQLPLQSTRLQSPSTMAHSRDNLHQIKTQSSAISLDGRGPPPKGHAHLPSWIFCWKKTEYNWNATTATTSLWGVSLRRIKALKMRFLRWKLAVKTWNWSINKKLKTLDISHQQLYAEYQDSCSRLMVDDIKWGKIAVLLFFTSVLAKRLYEENKTPLIDSIVGWQTTFLHNFTQWILEHGGWVRDCCMHV